MVAIFQPERVEPNQFLPLARSLKTQGFAECGQEAMQVLTRSVSLRNGQAPPSAWLFVEKTETSAILELAMR